MIHAEANRIAQGLVEYLAPTCERISVAGSLRRGKPNVKDIEIVALPIWDGDPLTDAKVGHSQIDNALDELLFDAKILYDTEVPRNGLRYKCFKVMHNFETIIAVDLFLADRANFGNQMAIRTGDAGFSKALVTPQNFGGMMRYGLFQQDGYLWKRVDGEKVRIDCLTEETFFRELGMAFPDPRKRTTGEVKA